MTWRDILGVSESIPDSPSHYSHNSHKSQYQGTSASTANIANRGADKKQALQVFVKLVRSNAALNHCRLLNLSEIEAQLSEKDRADLLTTPKPERQAWAEALAYRLCRERP